MALNEKRILEKVHSPFVVSLPSRPRCGSMRLHSSTPLPAPRPSSPESCWALSSVSSCELPSVSPSVPFWTPGMDPQLARHSCAKLHFLPAQEGVLR